MAELRDVVTLAQAADESGRNLAALQKAAQRGKLRAIKVGRPSSQVWVTTRADVAEWIADAELAKADNRARWEAMVKAREAKQAAAEKRRVERLLAAGRAYWAEHPFDPANGASVPDLVAADADQAVALDGQQG